ILRREIDSKPGVEQLKAIQASLLKELERLRVAVCPRALWTWSNSRTALHWRGRPQPIAWSVEKLNSLPNVFHWESDRTYIEIAIGGFYYVAASIFALGKIATR
ncbi:MAG: hypothetical protein SGPRY_004539, partial [Prymnesium sp.]